MRSIRPTEDPLAVHPPAQPSPGPSKGAETRVALHASLLARRASTGAATASR